MCLDTDADLAFLPLHVWAIWPKLLTVLVASGGHQLPVPTICFYPKIELNLLIKIELTCNKCGKHANITEEKKSAYL